jgi:hypothetical protein
MYLDMKAVNIVIGQMSVAAPPHPYNTFMNPLNI